MEAKAEFRSLFCRNHRIYYPEDDLFTVLRVLHTYMRVLHTYMDAERWLG